MGCKAHSWSIWKRKRHSGEGPRHEVREVIAELSPKGKVGVCQTDGRKLLVAKGVNIPRERREELREMRMETMKETMNHLKGAIEGF